jgi:hypothetical protein
MTSHFRRHVDAAALLARELREHSSHYETALRTSVIPSAISDCVARFLSEIEAALEALTEEVSACWEVSLAVGEPWHDHLLQQVQAHSASLATRLQAALREVDADGWLSQFEAVCNGALPLNLRRGTTRITITPGADGIPIFDTRAADGSSLLIMGPLRMNGCVGEDGVQHGYYLAVFADASELALFLNRVVIGIERLAASLRQISVGPT